MIPYNAILYLSGVAAVGGVYENRNLAKAAMPILLVPMLIGAQHWGVHAATASSVSTLSWWNKRPQAVPT